MRVLFHRDELHTWHPRGHFTIHADHAVTWRTQLSPVQQHASLLDGDVRLPPALDARARRLLEPHGTLMDALALDGTRVAAVVGEQYAWRLIVVDLDSSATELDVLLEADPPRVPGFLPEEGWTTLTRFAGSEYNRGIRLALAAGGVTVAANESGHVGFFSFATSSLELAFRVPGAREHIVCAVRVPEGLLVSIGRYRWHEEILLVSNAGELISRWPDPEAAEPVRWGMTQPLVLGRCVLTFSEWGPQPCSLYLLELPALREIAHHALARFPSLRPDDAAGDPATGRFAMGRQGGLVLGVVRDGAFESVEYVPCRALLERSGIEPVPLPVHATVDGRGERHWLRAHIKWWSMHGGRPVLAGDEQALVLETDGSWRTLFAIPPLPPGTDPLAGRVAGRPSIVAIGHGRLVVRDKGRLRLVALDTGAETASVAVADSLTAAVTTPRGVAFNTAQRSSSAALRPRSGIWWWTDGTSEPQQIAVTAKDQAEPVVVSGDAVWFFDVDWDVEWGSRDAPRVLCRWTEGSADVLRIVIEPPPGAATEEYDPVYWLSRWGPAMPCVLSVFSGYPFITSASRDELLSVLPDGTVSILPGYFPQPPVSVLFTRTHVIWTTEELTENNVVSRLWTSALATMGSSQDRRPELLAESDSGTFSELRLEDGRLCWLELRILELDVRAVDGDAPLVAFCSVPFST